jgi:hypothetical protein
LVPSRVARATDMDSAKPTNALKPNVLMYRVTVIKVRTV